MMKIKIIKNIKAEIFKFLKKNRYEIPVFNKLIVINFILRPKFNIRPRLPKLNENPFFDMFMWNNFVSLIIFRNRKGITNLMKFCFS